jgi:ABC-type transporter Mla subunit MlaD
MSARDGPDIEAVYQLLGEVARIVSGHDRRFDEHDRRFDAILARLDEHAGKLNELVATVDDHTRKLDDLGAGLADLRETLTHYHSSVPAMASC